MAEYIKRERAIVDACNSLDLYPYEYAKLEDALNKIPAADVVPVVRCKDCIHWDAEGCGCSLFLEFGENDFCSYGERKEGAE